MGLGSIFEIATDPTFRELSNFITPPRAGKVTAIEVSGQVRVDTDDPDGGDVLAWPLDGAGYAVDDVVYVQFGVNSPDSAVVVGGRNNASSISLVQLTTTGATGRFYRNLTAGSTDSPVVSIIDDHSGDDQTALRVQQDGTGDIISLFDGATEVFTVEDGGDVMVTDVIKLRANDTLGRLVGGTGIDDAAFLQYTGVSMASDGSRGNFDFHANTKNSTAGGLISFYQYDGVSVFSLMGRFTRTKQFLIGSATTGSAQLDVTQNITSGNALRVTRNLTATSTDAAVVDLIQDHASDDQVLIRGQQDGSGDILNLFDGATEVVTVLDGGNFGLNVVVPQGRFHGFDGTGGMLLVTKTGVAGTSVVIIPNGTGDVTRCVQMTGIIRDSAGTRYSAVGRVDNGSNLNFDDGGGNRLVFTVNVNGEFSAARTLGALTYDFTIWCVWQ